MMIAAIEDILLTSQSKGGQQASPFLHPISFFSFLDNGEDGGQQWSPASLSGHL